MVSAVRLPLLERISGKTPQHYDSANDVIPNVKILGLYSQNEKGRIYLEDALREAVPLYENCAVFDDHPMTPDGKILPRKPRQNRERIGSFRNVHFVEGKGLFGDLIVLRSHPTGKALLEAARDPNKHDFFAISHNTDGKTRTRTSDGVLLVEKILEVRSCDVVQGGGTTKSLFEQHTRVKTMKFKELLEMLSVDRRLPAKRRRAILEAAMDDDALPMDAEMEEPAMDDTGGVTDADQALEDGFLAAVTACWQDKGMDRKTKLKKIKDLLDAQEKLLGNGDAAPPAKVDDLEEARWSDGSGYNNKKEQNAMFARLREDGELGDVQEQHRRKSHGTPLTEQEVKALCETANVTAKPEIIKALVGMSLSTALPLLRELTEAKTAKARHALRLPVSTSANHALTEQRKSPATDQAAEIRRWKAERN